jgi:acetyl-CoA/propionyl-CoA carboxylase biotin carboxyl carrier protein
MDTPEFASGQYWTTFITDQLDFSGLEKGTTPATPEDEELEERSMTVEVGGRRFVVRYWAPVMATSQSGGQRAAPRRRAPKLERQAGGGEGEGVVTAPMQGTIVKVHKAAGSEVEAGEPVCVLEAMKMENEIKAPVGGEIVDLRVQPGDTVASGAVIMVIR